jgi:hypothetical protein
MFFLILSCILLPFDTLILLFFQKIAFCRKRFLLPDLDLIQYEKRQFPSVLHFWEFASTALFAISFLIGGKNPQKDVWCYDAGTYANQSNNTACGVQGIESGERE